MLETIKVTQVRERSSYNDGKIPIMLRDECVRLLLPPRLTCKDFVRDRDDKVKAKKPM
jgi:hypothetical protein